MTDIIRNLFAWLKRPAQAKQAAEDRGPAIAAGELWQFVPDASPWPSKYYKPVKILDVRDGWVRYDMGGSFNDERHKVKTFVAMYRRMGSRREGPQ